MADKPPTVKVTQKHPNPARNSISIGTQLSYVALWQAATDRTGLRLGPGCGQTLRSCTAWQNS